MASIQGKSVLASSLKHRVAALEDTLDQLTATRNSLRNNATQVKNQIQTAVGQQLEELRLREIWLLQQVEVIQQFKDDTLCRQVEQMTHVHGAASSDLCLAETAETDAEQTCVKLQELITMVDGLNLNVEETPYVTFRADSGALKSAIQQFGHVESKGLHVEIICTEQDSQAGSQTKPAEEYADEPHQVLLKILSGSENTTPVSADSHPQTDQAGTKEAGQEVSFVGCKVVLPENVPTEQESHASSIPNMADNAADAEHPAPSDAVPAETNKGAESGEKRKRSPKEKKTTGTPSVLRKKRKENPDTWDGIQSREELEATDSFAVVPSRLAAAPSNCHQPYQQLIMVSGKELIRRCAGPEYLTHTVLGQMLRIGKGTPAFKALGQLLGRVKITAERKTSPETEKNQICDGDIMDTSEAEKIRHSDSERLESCHPVTMETSQAENMETTHAENVESSDLEMTKAVKMEKSDTEKTKRSVTKKKRQSGNMKKTDRKTNTIKLSSFTLLTEGEVAKLVSDAAHLAELHISTPMLAQVLWDEAPGKSTIQKLASLQIVQEMLQSLCHAFSNSCGSFNLCTHGGKGLFEVVFVWVRNVLEYTMKAR